MKRLALIGVAALLLSGCGTLGGLTGEEKLAVLKGASEHLQTCTRIYNVNSGFPPSTSVAITCMPPAPQGLTPEQVADMIAKALAAQPLSPFLTDR